MPKIQLTTPDGSTLEFEVTADPARFGRAEDNDFVIPDASVSSYHGQISTNGESISIKDNGSTNGTHVGGERVTEADLAPGDAFRLGSVNGIVVGEVAALTYEEEEAGSIVAEEEYVEEEAAPAPAPSRSWGAPSPGPSGMPVSMMAGNIGSTPCPSQMRRGFGAKTKSKQGGGGMIMLLGFLGLAVCGAAAFMILQMGA